MLVEEDISTNPEVLAKRHELGTITITVFPAKPAYIIKHNPPTYLPDSAGSQIPEKYLK